MSRILKWPVPVDDQWHPIGAGPVLHVGCQAGPGTVQVWTLEPDGRQYTRPARVYGTGQPLPDEPGAHIGSAIADPFVWHVFAGEVS